MSRWLKLLAAVLVAAAVVVSPAAVSAGPGDGSGQGSGGSGDGTISAGAVYSTGGRSDSISNCSWEPVQTIGNENVATVFWPNVRDGVTYNLWRRTCDGVESFIELPETQPRDLLPTLLEELKARHLPVPEPAFLMLDPEFGWAYVRTPLDFRAGGGTWDPVSVSASVGPVWATATARPTTLTFDPGDPAAPDSVSCVGTDPVAGYAADAPGACSYTYLNASSTSPYDGYHFLTRFTIDWSISWTSSSGQGGPLAPHSTTSTAELAVAEVKGVVTCTGALPEQGGC